MAGLRPSRLYRGGLQGPPDTFRMTIFTGLFRAINRVCRIIFGAEIAD